MPLQLLDILHELRLVSCHLSRLPLPPPLSCNLATRQIAGAPKTVLTLRRVLLGCSQSDGPVLEAGQPGTGRRRGGACFAFVLLRHSRLGGSRDGM